MFFTLISHDNPEMVHVSNFPSFSIKIDPEILPSFQRWSVFWIFCRKNLAMSPRSRAVPGRAALRPACGGTGSAERWVEAATGRSGGHQGDGKIHHLTYWNRNIPWNIPWNMVMFIDIIWLERLEYLIFDIQYWNIWEYLIFNIIQLISILYPNSGNIRYIQGISTRQIYSIVGTDSLIPMICVDSYHQHDFDG